VTPLTHGRRFGVTALLLAVGLACVAVASVTHSVIPVFLAWIPLLALPWWLTRPVVGDPGAAAAPAEDARQHPEGGAEEPVVREDAGG
jgi:hypothetical protein